MQGIYTLEYDLHKFLYISDTESMDFRKAMWMHDQIIKDIESETEELNNKVTEVWKK